MILIFDLDDTLYKEKEFVKSGFKAVSRYLHLKFKLNEKKIFLQGQLLDNINRQKTKISNFGDVEFSVFSQFGEDGIISWLTDKVPNIKKVFVEIGTQDYWEANTRYLIKSKKWKGYLIEGSKDDVKKIKRQRIYWQNDLRAIDAFINKDNINHIVENNIT